MAEHAESTQREADAAARAERQKSESIEAERRKAAAEAEKRAHRGDVNARAIAALFAAGLPWSAAEVAVVAVMSGKVPGMTMVY